LSTIVDQLEHLPGIVIDGNHTISLRGLMANESGGHSASSVVAVNVLLMDTANAKTFGQSEGGLSNLAGWVLPTAGVVLVVLLLGGVVLINRAERSVEVESIKWGSHDEDIDAVVDQAEAEFPE